MRCLLKVFYQLISQLEGRENAWGSIVHFRPYGKYNSLSVKSIGSSIRFFPACFPT